MANLGFVGLGVMGGRIARRLLAAGHRVTGYNRTKTKAQWLLDAGMRWAESPRAVAQAADVVFTMVTDTAALHAVARGADGVLAGLSPGKIYVEMSTVSPAASRDLAGDAGGRGAQMVGGDRSAFERVKPILLDIGPTVNYVGGNGQAVLMKIATNLSLAVHMLAFSEGVALAEKGGIARETAVAVLLSSVVASPMLKYRGPFVLRPPDEAWFDVTMMQKDLGLALELGRQLSVPLPTTAVTNEWLSAARSMGLGRQDFAAVFEVVTHLAGLLKRGIQDPETETHAQRTGR